MLVSGIRSRPVYGTLEPNTAAHTHLVVADGEGALAVLDLFAAATTVFAANARVLYVAGASAAVGHAAKLAALGAASFIESPTIASLLPRLDVLLANARMGTQLYAAGTEPLIGEVVRVAGVHGVSHLAIRTEHRGSLARRVQCVHCKGITEPVTTSIVPCAHCGLHLLVRDHYSRRIGAFQGVNIDAEEPGRRPPAEPVFA
jgi:predicted RNA-binding Zn-ribbon protein involved in translation (DUF1610 family)